MTSQESGQRPPAHLVVLCGSQEGRIVALEAEETLVGRSPNVDLALADEGVSREHALLSYDEAAGAWTLEDLQSTNGTRVNGKRVRSRALTPGDEIQIGNVRLTFAAGEAAGGSSRSGTTR